MVLFNLPGEVQMSDFEMPWAEPGDSGLRVLPMCFGTSFFFFCLFGGGGYPRFGV